MKMRYLLWNPTASEIRVGADVIPPDGLGSKVYPVEELLTRFSEFQRLGLRPCLVCPCHSRLGDGAYKPAHADPRLPMGPAPELLDATLIKQPRIDLAPGYYCEENGKSRPVYCHACTKQRACVRVDQDNYYCAKCWNLKSSHSGQ